MDPDAFSSHSHRGGNRFAAQNVRPKCVGISSVPGTPVVSMHARRPTIYSQTSTKGTTAPNTSEDAGAFNAWEGDVPDSASPVALCAEFTAETAAFHLLRGSPTKRVVLFVHFVCLKSVGGWHATDFLCRFLVFVPFPCLSRETRRDCILRFRPWPRVGPSKLRPCFIKHIGE